jgi:heme exporter protein A
MQRRDAARRRSGPSLLGTRLPEGFVPDSTSPHTHEGLYVDGLARRFGPRWVLARVTVHVPRGGALLLLGANGSGKTTLLRCIASALAPHEGRILLDGESIWEHRQRLRRDIALLSHDTALYDDLSASQNLQVWARMGGYEADVPALLERVGLQATGPKPVRAFSAGMRRRLALARALLKRPRLVLFDEPFSALDAQGRDVVAEVLRDVRAQGATLVLSTHHPGIGGRFCDDAIRIEAGQVAWRGTAAMARDQVEQP